MLRIVSSLGALLLVFSCFAPPARAQSNTTWVSGLGLDTNDCFGPATPCRQISAALGKTNPGGTVHVLPGRYNSFTITKSLEILADAGQAEIVGGIGPAPGGTGGIVVAAAATDLVRIRGFSFALSNGSDTGISFALGGALHLENCTVASSDTNYGVIFAPIGASELYISNCAISGNGTTSGGGILVEPTGSGSAKLLVDATRVENNRVGILVNGARTTGGILITVSDSTISGSTAAGLGVFEAASGGTPTGVAVARTTLSGNGGQGIVASRSSATVRVRLSMITGNAVGVQSLNGGQIISHGDNVLAGNGTNGAFTATLPSQ